MRIFDRLASLRSTGTLQAAPPQLDIGRQGQRGLHRGLDVWYSVAYLACELAKARPMATLPAHVYRHTGGGRTAVPDDPLGEVLKTSWNPWVSAPEGMRWLVMRRDTMGVANVRVEYDRDGQVSALWPVEAPVTPMRNGRHAVYRVEGGDDFTPAGTYQAWEMLRVKSPVAVANGVGGRSLAELSAENIGLSIDLEGFYSKLITNGNHFPGYLATDQALGPKDLERIAEGLKGTSGVMEAGRVRVFDKGLKYHTVEMTMADMNLIEQQTWVLEQTCRVLSVPPQEVYDLSHATYSNVEQGAVQFCQKTLLPEVVDIETAFNCVLHAQGKRDMYVKFDMSGLMRGTFAERQEGYRTSVLGGWKTLNDVRRDEDEEPLPGLDVTLRPLSYATVDADGTVRAADTSAGARSALDPEGGDHIIKDMRRRVRERFENKGDVESSRAFARRVFEPYALACEEAGVPFDLEGEVAACATSTSTGL